MSKKSCEIKDYALPPAPKFECKKCGRKAVKEKNICKPKVIWQETKTWHID